MVDGRKADTRAHQCNGVFAVNRQCIGHTYDDVWALLFFYIKTTEYQ